MGLFCSARLLLLILLISAIPIPIAILISQESSKPTSHQFHFHSSGYLRECSKYDSLNTRLIVSFIEGGLGIIPISNTNTTSNTILPEIPVVKDKDLFRNATLGFSIDAKRNRVVVATSDLLGNKYSAVAAYDLSDWSRLFLTQLSAPGDKSMADDVAVDAEGNAYITDVNKSKIWKVGVTGEYLLKIESPLFSPTVWYHNLVTLNGIVYHPKGYLLVSHTTTGNLFKVDIKNDNEVKLVKMIGKSKVFEEEVAPGVMSVAAGLRPAIKRPIPPVGPKGWATLDMRTHKGWMGDCPRPMDTLRAFENMSVRDYNRHVQTKAGELFSALRVGYEKRKLEKAVLDRTTADAQIKIATDLGKLLEARSNEKAA